MSKKEGIRQEECVWGPLHGCKFATEIEKEGERHGEGRLLAGSHGRLEKV